MGRLCVFIDYENVSRRARAYFHLEAAPPPWAGHVSPLRLAELIRDRDDHVTELVGVRVYRGRPDATRQPESYAANLRQCAYWEQTSELITVTWRTLRYPDDWPASKAEEKGIDVALAIDVVMMAMREEYDIGAVVSTDTDLKPALEAVAQMGGSPYPRNVVAAWSPADQRASRLSIVGRKVWCHWLDHTAYEWVADTTDYVRLGLGT